MNFKELGISDNLIRVLAKEGIVKPTPIQELTIPIIKDGKDLLGIAQTGSGKTAAYALPIIEKILFKQRKELNTLVLCSTRELAMQIRNAIVLFANYKVGVTTIVGGVKERIQLSSIKKGVDIIVATPGRLNDLVSRRKVNLAFVDTVVLDEADTMLDMGFIKDIRFILSKTRTRRQTMLFSATMPKEIVEIAKEFLKEPEKIEILSKRGEEPQIEEELYTIKKEMKNEFLLDYLTKNDVNQAIIFTRTKYGADKLWKYLSSYNISCTSIHGDKTQGERVRNLKGFKEGKYNYLIATDIAARGLDIVGLPYVINYDIPEQAEVYIHRIGRTARAGKTGKAITICTKEDITKLKAVEKLIKHKVTIIEDNIYYINLNIKDNYKPKSNNKSFYKQDKSNKKRKYYGNNKKTKTFHKDR